MDPIYAQLGAAGVTVVVLIGGMKWIADQYVAMRNKLDESARACADREAAMQDRISSLEDTRAKDQQSIILATTEALKLSAHALERAARAFEKLTEDSGQHRTRDT